MKHTVIANATALFVAAALAALLPASPGKVQAAALPKDHDIPANRACWSTAPDGDTKLCYIDVIVKDGEATTDTEVDFGQPDSIFIAWRVKVVSGASYGFEDDGLWLPATADVKEFDNPCTSDDAKKCVKDDGIHGYFYWHVKKPAKGTKFEYKLKLYPTVKSLGLEPIMVRARSSEKKANGDPIWVDPTIVIQG